LLPAQVPLPHGQQAPALLKALRDPSGTLVFPLDRRQLIANNELELLGNTLRKLIELLARVRQV
jgi:hypothetical protein